MPKLLRVPLSAFIDDVVFVAACDSRDVFQLDTRSDQWSVLPSCPLRLFGLGQLSGKLVTVGGKEGRGATVSDVYMYVQETQQWEKSIPPMPTPRSYPTVVNYQSCIIVCGGFEGNQVVEVFNIELAQWYTAAPLPVACEGMQSTVINDVCYLGGGRNNRSVMCASLPTLLRSSISTPHNQVWTLLPDLPHYGSSLTNMGQTLLALGGEGSTSASLPSQDIDAYCPNTKAWVEFGRLSQACISATAELLPSGEVILIGGRESPKKWTKNVYIISEEHLNAL